MERKLPPAFSARDTADVVLTASGNPESPVTPDMVLEGIRSTVNQLGRDIGRTTFLGIFPGQENAFDRFFNQAAETQRLLGEVA